MVDCARSLFALLVPCLVLCALDVLVLNSISVFKDRNLLLQVVACLYCCTYVLRPFVRSLFPHPSRAGQDRVGATPAESKRKDHERQQWVSRF